VRGLLENGARVIAQNAAVTEARKRLDTHGTLPLQKALAK